MDGISKWEEAEKRGRRVYDDGKFYQSILDQFTKSANITEKQWNALLNLALKYKAQIPGFDNFITE